MIDVVVAVILSIGLFFMAIAALGFIRFPDVFSRLHVTGILDTLGAPFILLAAAFHLGLTLDAAKLLLAVLFLYATSPLVGHLLSRAALASKEK